MTSNATGTTTSNVTLFERTDVHKSCKALELVVNLFNDYCQAAESMSAMQKKLAKALKDAAACKGTGELVVNGLTTVASAFDTLSEAEARFVKTADRECEGSSNEVKKWFKKLAKEEKAHDDRIAAANAKIKQAGQAYEKKAKRKDRDAAEEHSRYVNLLSVVGPEMSQEKFKHTSFVTERHTATLSLLAASLSRTAEAEWARVCESVRRLSLIVGKVGECRAFLEGGWTSSIPDATDGDDTSEKPRGNPDDDVNANAIEMKLDAQRPPAYYSPVPSTSSSTTSSQIPPAAGSPAQPKPTNISQASSPPTSFVKPFSVLNATNTDSVRSIESLSNFPSPPTHFPLPSLLQQTVSVPNKLNIKEEGIETNLAVPESIPRVVLTDSPISAGESLNPEVEDIPKASGIAAGRSDNPMSNGEGSNQRSEVYESQSVKTIKPNAAAPQGRDDSGAMFIDAPEPLREPRSGSEKSEESKHKPAVVRSESVTSSTSVVAQLRDKLSQDITSTSPPREREKPRLSYRVSDLVNKYGPSGSEDRPTSPISPRHTGTMQRQASPSTERLRSSPKLDRRQLGQESPSPTVQRVPPPIAEPSSPAVQSRPRTFSQTTTQGTAYASEDLLAARRRHIEELEELEFREQSHALRERERQIEMQTLELERERLRILTLGVGTRATGDRAVNVRPHSQHSYSTTNLVQPRANGSAADLPLRPTSHYGEPLIVAASHSSGSSNSTGRATDHAPYCGCQTCASASYASPGRISETTLAAKAEKPKGWIRRLSMPVVSNAFLSGNDTKKGNGAITMGGHHGGVMRGYGVPSEDGRLIPQASFERDATGGISNVTSHSRSRKLSFGRR